jgi:glycosyltransferase involved in cell wall biosynthesis
LSDLVERRFAICAVLNDSEAKYFSSNNVKVIPNPINIPIYEKHSREKIVVAAGRIAAVKGYDLLIKAWQHVAAMHPDWKLHIYGDGDDNLQKKLQAQLERLGLHNSVSFCGVTKNLNQVFFKSSIHVLSSYEESFGMVILEAQSCGLSSVAFNCPTGPEKLIVNNENGFLLIPGDINGMSEKLNYLIENPEIRQTMGTKALLNAKKYNVISVIKIWDFLFAGLK